jgi:hypothetical protein
MEKVQVQDNNPSILEQAQQTAARLEKANAELKELLDRQQRAREIDLVSGRSPAGEVKKEMSQEELKRKEAIEYFKGSEIEGALKKYG